MSTVLTPVMRQYHQLKEQNPDCLLFFRMGDFYELFFDDAVKAAAALDITLTRRGKTEGEDIPMCGVPFHAAESYLARLIKQGFRVAVSEQMGSESLPKTGGKALMRRDVVRIITPGTVTEETLLDAKSNNFIMAVDANVDVGKGLAVSVFDLSTGEFCVEELEPSDLQSALSRYAPSEILLKDSFANDVRFKSVLEAYRQRIVVLSHASFGVELGKSHLKRVLHVSELEGFGAFTSLDYAVMAAVVDYTLLTQKGQFPRIDAPRKVVLSNGLEIDPATRRNFELIQTLSGQKKGSLLSLMDRTVTSAGGRLLGQRLNAPLSDVGEINGRLDAVEWFFHQDEMQAILRDHLRHVGDMERSLSRLKLGRGGPRDMAVVAQTLKVGTQIYQALAQEKLPQKIRQALQSLVGHDPLVIRLSSALGETLPLLVRDGGFIRQGFHGELDEIRQIRDHGRQMIAGLQVKYATDIGVASLKIKHNNILGYYIELLASHAAKVPETFIHRQTMAGAMRFVTVELSGLESKMIAAADEALQLELALYQELVEKIFSFQREIVAAARALAELDVMTALCELARHQAYVRPEINDKNDFLVEQGRHPIVEAFASAPFIPNDCDLSEGQNLWLLTGPNMAGKSTFLRQNGLIVIMAQMGSFVPAKRAVIGVVDKLFSRVGASDDLASGRSTFMVEMVETAIILNQATQRSLVILDEVGRGTSTFDGMSIAWAVVEHLGNVIGPRCLFATHYHELTALANQVKGLVCQTVKIKEWKGEIYFMHEIIPGQADRSYGLHVAALAGLPPPVLIRAKDILTALEEGRARNNIRVSENTSQDLTLSESASVDETAALAAVLMASIEEIDVDRLSPREALDKLYDMKRTFDSSAQVHHLAGHLLKKNKS